MTTYRYIAADGDVLTGTLTEIGEAIYRWHGDICMTNNPAPWEAVGDNGDSEPRNPSVEEMIEWIARAEDRPDRHVKDALTELQPPVQTEAVEALLGEAAADLIDRHGDDAVEQLAAVLESLPVLVDQDETARTNGVLRAAFGEVTLEMLARRLLAARIREQEALDELIGACAWEAARGMGEPTLSARSGLARKTIRRGLGRG